MKTIKVSTLIENIMTEMSASAVVNNAKKALASDRWKKHTNTRSSTTLKGFAFNAGVIAGREVKKGDDFDDTFIGMMKYYHGDLGTDDQPWDRRNKDITGNQYMEYVLTQDGMDVFLAGMHDGLR